METKIRIRHGDLEVECTGDEVFVATRLPELLSELLRRIGSQPPSPTSQPGPEPRPIGITGDVRDYFTDGPIEGALVTAAGLVPELSATSDASGHVVLLGQAAGSDTRLTVAGVDAFAPTTTGPFVVASATLTLPVFAVANVDLERQYTALGLTRPPGSTVVIVHLLDTNLAPLELVPASDLVLADAGGRPVGDGPYFFGPGGDVQPRELLSVSRAFEGRARAAFLAVPAGDSILQLTVARPGGGFQRVTVRVRALGGASIVHAALA
jgi:hypothetical protein